MRIFDVYEHPSFEVEKADKTAAVRATITIRRLGVGATLSAAIAAIGFWGYYCLAQSNTIGFEQVGALHRLAFGAESPFRFAKWGGVAFEGT